MPSLRGLLGGFVKAHKFATISEKIELTECSLFMETLPEALPAFQLMQLLLPDSTIKLSSLRYTLYTLASVRLLLHT